MATRPLRSSDREEKEPEAVSDASRRRPGGRFGPLDPSPVWRGAKLPPNAVGGPPRGWDSGLAGPRPAWPANSPVPAQPAALPKALGESAAALLSTPMGPNGKTLGSLLEEAYEDGAEDGDAPAPTPASTGSFRWAPGEAERLSLFPIRHDDIWEYRKKIEGLHWTAQEPDLTRDRLQWVERLTAEEQQFITWQLAFFARIDIDVFENVGARFSAEVDCLEARMVYAAQQDQECVHAEGYALQIKAVLAGAEQDRILNAVRHLPVVARMRGWVTRWAGAQAPVGERLVAFAAVEGVLFSASFCALQWLRSRNLLPGITHFNDFIARDEAVHTAFTCLLVRRYLVAPPSAARAGEIFDGAVECVDALVDSSLPAGIPGMNAELMRQYVRFQADCVLADLGHPPRYRASNPFPFMDALALNEVSKANFFEERPTQYQNLVSETGGLLVLDDTPEEE